MHVVSCSSPHEKVLLRLHSLNCALFDYFRSTVLICPCGLCGPHLHILERVRNALLGVLTDKESYRKPFEQCQTNGCRLLSLSRVSPVPMYLSMLVLGEPDDGQLRRELTHLVNHFQGRRTGYSYQFILIFIFLLPQTFYTVCHLYSKTY